MSAIEPAGQLAELECVIERGLETFIEVGQALMRIREERLYQQAGYSSFESYCRERWGHRRAWADRHISAVRKVAQLDPAGSTPATEWEARQLDRPPASSVEADAREFGRLYEQLRSDGLKLLGIILQVMEAGYPLDQFDLEAFDCGKCSRLETVIRRHIPMLAED